MCDRNISHALELYMRYLFGDVIGVEGRVLHYDRDPGR